MAASLLAQIDALARRGIRLSQEDSQLRVDAPRDALEPDDLSFLRENKAALLSAIEQRAKDRAPIPVVERGGRLRLSGSQQRLWFLEQLGAGSAYVNSGAYRLDGALDEAALRGALVDVVSRHEVLRTRFEEEDGEPVQVVDGPSAFALERVDLTQLPAAEREAAAERAAQASVSAPFDLGAGPLIRGCLVRLAADRHVLAVAMHHIVSDGWSLGVLMREVTQRYAARRGGAASPLAPLEVQYADYAAWQRARSDGGALADHLAYWKAHLTGAPELLELPVDRPRRALRGHGGGMVPVALPAPLVAGLRGLARRHGATLFMVVLAGWSALLSRLSGQDEVVVGTPVANRQRRELEGLIGFFVNTLALRVPVGGLDVAGLVGAVRETTLSAYAHQEVPFEQVVEAVQPSRSLGHSPLFQAMLSFDNTPREAVELGGLRLSGLELPHSTTHFDLTLVLNEAGEGLAGGLEYAEDLFDRATIERWSGHLVALLEAMVADDRTVVARLPLLTGAERAMLLETFNATERSYPQQSCIHQLFEAQAAATPDAVAVVHQGAELSYAALDARANRLAHHLRALGVGPDERVAICMERSPEMVVALLAILKAGGAYVPLDPAYPAERLAYMLADSAPAALLTQASLADAVAGWQPEVPVAAVLVDEPATARRIAAQPATPPAVPDLTSANLAYIIYTSGSTGMPKGVMIEHRSTVTMLSWSRDTFRAEERACVLASTSICFDLSVFEMFLPLSWGGSMMLVDNALSGWPAEAGVTLINTVPSAITELVRSGGVPASVKVVALAGEPLHNSLAQAVYGLGVEAVFNLYGPSEDTTYSTCSRITPGGTAAVTIGRPISDTRCYLLNACGEPVPLGVVGELYIGGAGVARGYMNRPELTAERFLASPFVPGDRLYRTGDLARYQPDGNIEFLGRNDHQVKIRGYRIELGEIEARLAEHPQVREAVVVARQSGAGDMRLAAYVADGAAPDAGELRTFLRRSLPEYMVPATITVLDALPLNANGKIDRAKLPAPEAPLKPDAELPRTDTERQIAAIWSELLERDIVALDDNFFDIGGHSLLVVQMVSRLRERFGTDHGLSVVDLFVDATVRGLARRIEQAPPKSSDDAAAIQDRAEKQRAARARRRTVREKEAAE